MYSIFKALFFCGCLSLTLGSTSSYAQTSDKINWISFSQLNDSLQVKQKKVFVDFYSDWCAICKKMDRSTYLNDSIIRKLNRDYYAVRMNVETTDTIAIGDQIFVNKRVKRVNPVHEIALLLASRKNKPFSLPVMVLFDENFVATARYFQYLDATDLNNILSEVK